jgi:hypothetical protein
MSAWSHLPNAVHIDRILTSFRNNPAHWPGYPRRPEPEQQKAFHQVWHHLMSAGWNESRIETLINDCDSVWGSAWDAIRVLVAYDDSAKYLDLPVDQLQMLYALTEHPACVLLRPAVVVFAMEKELAQGCQ